MGLIWLISLRTYWNQELIKTKAKVMSYYLETGKPEILKNASSSGTVEIYWVMFFLYIIEMLEITGGFLLIKRAFNILT